MRQSQGTPAHLRGRSRSLDSAEPSEPEALVRWLDDGRGAALRHLGWPRLVRLIADRLRTDIARDRVLADLGAMNALLDGRADELDRSQRAALDRLPMLRPELDRAAAAARLDETRGAAVLLREGEGAGRDGDLPQIGASLSRLEDLDESLAVVRSGAASTVVELIGVAELCRACAEIGRAHELASARALDLDDERGLEAWAERLREVAARDGGSGPDPGPESGPVGRCPELLAELDRAIDRSGDEPRISAGASPALAEARSRVRAAKASLQAQAERLLRNATISEALRDAYWTERDGRIVLPVRNDRLGTVRERGAIIHGSSASGQTFYVEPARLVEGNNALREAELLAAEEERKVLRALSATVAARATTLRGMQRACVELDLQLARVALNRQLGARGPILVGASDPGGDPSDDRPAIDLRAARHPLMVLDGVEVVPNDIVLGRGHALIISGPNAGGKTVALKTLGLLALMAAAGLDLPCTGQPRIPVFSQIITDVGDDQSIVANLSTFSAHVGHVRQALEASELDGAATLVLLDEVAVGTDPQQGAALAEAILVALVEAGATVVVTTHYDRLKLLATQPATAACFHNAAVGFNLERMRPTFRLSLGVPGSSSAIAVARRLGLPPAVLDHAETLLGDEGVKIDELLRDIEAERQALARTRERLEREQLQLRQHDREVRVRERRVLEGVRSRKAKAYTAAVEQLRALESELKSKRKLLRRQAPERVDELPTRSELAGEARVALAEHRAEVEVEAVEAAAAASEGEVDPRTIAAGDRVRVLSMNREGEVVAVQGKPAKKVTVQLSQTLRTTVKPRDLARAPAPEPAPKRRRSGAKAEPIFDFRQAIEDQAAAHFGEGAKAISTSVDNVCDVRGQRYEDAQERVADFVAAALARDQDLVLIRHGHGGGALRKAVRELLDRLGTVRRQRPGLASEGGDAVTVAWLA